MDGYERQVFRSSKDSLCNKVNYNAYYGELGIHCLLVETPDRLVAGVTAFYPGSSTEFKHLYELSHLPLIFLHYQRDKIPSELNNSKISTSKHDLASMHEMRRSLRADGKLVGICLADGAFSYCTVANWQQIITPQQLPRDGSASLDPTTCKTVAKFRAPIEHLVGKFKQAKSCKEPFRPSKVVKAQLNVLIRAGIINLNQMVQNKWTDQQIFADLNSNKAKFFLDPFEDGFITENELKNFIPTPKKQITNSTKRLLNLLNGITLRLAYLQESVKMTFSNFKRARLLVESGHLNMLDYAIDKLDTVIMRAIVFAGYMNRQHMVILEMTKDQPVKNFYCTCFHSAIANEICRHVECVLIKIFQYQIASMFQSSQKYSAKAHQINSEFQKLFNCSTAFKIIEPRQRTYILQRESPVFKLREHLAEARKCSSFKLQKRSILLGEIIINI